MPVCRSICLKAVADMFLLTVFLKHERYLFMLTVANG